MIDQTIRICAKVPEAWSLNNTWCEDNRTRKYARSWYHIWFSSSKQIYLSELFLFIIRLLPIVLNEGIIVKQFKIFEFPAWVFSWLRRHSRPIKSKFVFHWFVHILFISCPTWDELLVGSKRYLFVVIWFLQCKTNYFLHVA